MRKKLPEEYEGIVCCMCGSDSTGKNYSDETYHRMNIENCKVLKED